MSLSRSESLRPWPGLQMLLNSSPVRYDVKRNSSSSKLKARSVQTTQSSQKPITRAGTSESQLTWSDGLGSCKNPEVIIKAESELLQTGDEMADYGDRGQLSSHPCLGEVVRCERVRTEDVEPLSSMSILGHVGLDIGNEVVRLHVRAKGGAAR